MLGHLQSITAIEDNLLLFTIVDIDFVIKLKTIHIRSKLLHLKQKIRNEILLLFGFVWSNYWFPNYPPKSKIYELDLKWLTYLFGINYEKEFRINSRLPQEVLLLCLLQIYFKRSLQLIS